MSLADAPADTIQHSSSHSKEKTRKKRAPSASLSHSEAAAADSPITDSHHHHHHRRNIRNPTDAQQHLEQAAHHVKEHKKKSKSRRAAPTNAPAVAVDAAPQQRQRRRSRHRPPSRDRIGSIDGDWDAGGKAGGREQHEPQAAPVLGVVDDDDRPRGRLGSGRRLSASRASSRGNNNAAGSATAMIDSQESLRSRQHPTSVKVKSPVSDKYVIVPTPNPPLRQSELSIDELHEARGNGFSAVAGVAVGAGPADMTAVFIDDGRGRFHPSRSPATYYDPDSRTITPSSDLEAGFTSHTTSSPTIPTTTDTLLLAFTHTFQSTLSHTLHIAHGLYAGTCLLSLILLPVFNQLDMPTTATTTTTVSSYRFLTWYSSHAGAVSVAFNTLATLAVLNAMDVVVARWRDNNDAFGATTTMTTGEAAVATLGNRHAVGGHGGNDPAIDAGAAKQHPLATRAQYQPGRQLRQRHWAVRETSAVFILLCTVISWLGAVLITPQDDKLWDSQQQAGYGPYGDPDWFASFSALTTAQVTSDLARWEALNGVRGVFGFLSGLHVFWPAPMRAAATTTPAGI
ncbi:hypothetical protein HDU88_006399 [Geranomyces variabilis]|nr:hypothetical protein HDU88_006399 [Geranomyces variabilis]